MKLLLILNLLLIPLLVSRAEEVDQSQTVANFVNDEGQGSGQTFTAGKNGFLVGLNLFMRSHNYPRDFRITLNTTSNGAPTTNVITSVDVTGSLVATGDAQWYSFSFTNAYPQRKGEVLAFVYYSLPAGDPVGWNDLAFDTNQSYPDGIQFTLYGDGSWLQPYPRRDYAFETVILSAPSLGTVSLSNNTFSVSTDFSETSLVYRLQYSTNLTSGLWFDYAVKTGTASSIDWMFPNATNKSLFFRLNIDEL